MESEEIELKIESTEIVPQQRKLKATWTYEARQDIIQWANQNAIDELIKQFAEEINAEIDQEILKEKPWGFKNKKSPKIRNINEDWEISQDWIED